MAEVGGRAPDFTLEATEKRTFRLSDFQGKNYVVLFFYPLDWTPV